MLFTIPNNGDIKRSFRSEQLKSKAEKSACSSTYINTYSGKGLSSMHRSIQRQGNDVSFMHVSIPYPCRAQKHTPIKRARQDANPVNMHVSIPYRRRGVSHTPTRRVRQDANAVNMHVSIPYPCRAQKHTPTKRPETGRIRVNRHVSRMRIKMNDDE